MQIPSLKLNNGLNIPVLGLGTWKLTGTRCIESLKKALELGYTHIDTAEIYRNEEEIGKAIKNYERNKLFITSKAWPDNLDYYRVLGMCEESLARLETSYLDQYLIHWPDKTLNMEDVLKAFKRLYDEKKIKSFGVSNFTINHLKNSLEIADKINLPITTNQVEFHPLLYQKELLEYCNNKNIKIVAYSPLAQGKLIRNPVLSEISKKYNKSPAQLSLRWLLDIGAIVIPKASSLEHLKENMNIFDFNLTEKDSRIISNLDNNERIVNPDFAEFDY